MALLVHTNLMAGVIMINNIVGVKLLLIALNKVLLFSIVNTLN